MNKYIYDNFNTWYMSTSKNWKLYRSNKKMKEIRLGTNSAIYALLSLFPTYCSFFISQFHISQLICFICMHEWYNNEPKCVKKEVFFFIIPSRNLLWRWFSIVAVRACVRMCDCVWISAFYTTLEDNPRMHVCETLYIL